MNLSGRPVNKIDCPVDIPLRLTLKSHEFELYAVINHKGGINSGHYTAVIKSYKDGNWYLFDDTQVVKITGRLHTPIQE
ncbi:hypothetical protein NFI96_019454, partial [Prochilodus magdalenae]